MSTKRLQKTVIEGGRYKGNKYDRYYSIRQQRSHARDFCKQVIIDPELAEEQDIEEQDHVYKGFSDKLRPMYRWLDAQVGRPWADVHSEIFSKFDTRTTAGRHITFDHLLSSISEASNGFDSRGYLVENSEAMPGYYYYYNSYYVNSEGIFCKSKKIPRTKYKAPVVADFLQYEAFLNNRMIMKYQGKLYWLCPTDGIWRASWFPLNYPYKSQSLEYPIKLNYFLLDNGEYQKELPSILNISGKSHGEHWELIENPFSFKQRGELSVKETKDFYNLPTGIQSDILSFTFNR